MEPEGFGRGFLFEDRMPLPKPKKDGESKKDFLERCMSSDVMNDEYPDEKQRYAVCNSLWDQEKKSRGEGTMAIKVNGKGNSHARNLINAGKVDKTGSWSFSADDGNKILGDDNWSEYAKWFLAADDSAELETKEHYKYPFGKAGKVYRRALTAIRQRAGQQGENDIFDAAGRLLEMIDGKEEDSLPAKNIEHRAFPVAEFRVLKDSDGRAVLEGYAAVFNKLSENLGGFREKVKAGAFKKTLKAADVRGLMNHDPNFVLGRTKSGTLELKEDTKGLLMKNLPPDTQWARDLMVSVGRGDIDQMSFGFLVTKDSWDEDRDKQPIRTLEEVELFDVSVVTYPAYPDTSVALRSMEAWRKDNGNKGIISIRAEGEVDFEDMKEVYSKVLAGEEIDDETRDAFVQQAQNLLVIFPEAAPMRVEGNVAVNEESRDDAPMRSSDGETDAPMRSDEDEAYMPESIREFMRIAGETKEGLTKLEEN